MPGIFSEALREVTETYPELSMPKTEKSIETEFEPRQ